MWHAQVRFGGVVSSMHAEYDVSADRASLIIALSRYYGLDSLRLTAEALALRVAEFSGAAGSPFCAQPELEQFAKSLRQQADWLADVELLFREALGDQVQLSGESL